MMWTELWARLEYATWGKPMGLVGLYGVMVLVVWLVHWLVTYAI